MAPVAPPLATSLGFSCTNLAKEILSALDVWLFKCCARVNYNKYYSRSKMIDRLLHFRYIGISFTIFHPQYHK